MNTITTAVLTSIAVITIAALMKLSQRRKIARIESENQKMREEIARLKRHKRIAYKVATTAAEQAQEKAPEEAPEKTPEEPDEVRKLLAEINGWRIKHAELAGAYHYVPLKTINGKTRLVRVNTN